MLHPTLFVGGGTPKPLVVKPRNSQQHSSFRSSFSPSWLPARQHFSACPPKTLMQMKITQLLGMMQNMRIALPFQLKQ